MSTNYPHYMRANGPTDFMGCPEHEPEPETCDHTLCEFERCDNCSPHDQGVGVCISQLVIIEGANDDDSDAIFCIDCADYMEIPSCCREPYTLSY